MKKNNYRYLIICFTVLIMCISCSDDITKQPKVLGHQKIHELYIEDNDGQAALYHMPLASIEELDSYATIESIIPYRLARQYAFIEFMANAEALLPSYIYQNIINAIQAGVPIPLALTNRPAIVYNYDYTPYYYEFGVIYGNELVTVITVYAHKMPPQQIAFVGAATYSSYSFDYQRYVGNYPAVYYDVNGAFQYLERDEEGRISLVDVDANNLQGVIFTDPIEILQNKLSNIPLEDFETMNNDLISFAETNLGLNIFSLSSYISDAIVRVDSLSQVLENRLIALASDSIEDSFYLTELQRGIIISILDYDQSHSAFLPEYNSNLLRLTHWLGYCGPAAMAWLYRGKWSTYQGTYIPICGDSYNYPYSYEMYYPGSCFPEYLYLYSNYYGSNWELTSMEIDNGLSWNWYQHCTSFGALYESGLRSGLIGATYDNPEHYTIKFTVVPRRWIYEFNEPVVIECSPEPYYEPHYLAAFAVVFNDGCAGNPVDRFFLVTDNTVQTDLHCHYPYWKGYCFFNLHYGWERCD